VRCPGCRSRDCGLSAAHPRAGDELRSLGGRDSYGQGPRDGYWLAHCRNRCTAWWNDRSEGGRRDHFHSRDRCCGRPWSRHEAPWADSGGIQRSDALRLQVSWIRVTCIPPTVGDGILEDHGSTRGHVVWRLLMATVSGTACLAIAVAIALLLFNVYVLATYRAERRRRVALISVVLSSLASALALGAFIVLAIAEEGRVILLTFFGGWIAMIVSIAAGPAGLIVIEGWVPWQRGMMSADAAFTAIPRWMPIVVYGVLAMGVLTMLYALYLLW